MTTFFPTLAGTILNGILKRLLFLELQAVRKRTFKSVGISMDPRVSQSDSVGLHPSKPYTPCRGTSKEKDLLILSQLGVN